MTVEPKMSECGILVDLDIEGSASGDLLGKTFVVKDFFDVEGFVTGGGNPDWQRTHQPAVENARCVSQLLAAGARLRGKSCTDELALSLDGINPYFGTPLNRQLPNHIPGGSSSGSASAVSCGLVDFGIGTDTAGSIRVPASYCGIFGFRPTHGAVDISGAIPLGQSFDTVGWLTRDADLLFDVGQVLLGQKSFNEITKAVVARNLFELIPLEIGQQFLFACDHIFEHVERSPDLEISSHTLDTCASIFGIIRSCEAWRNFGPWLEEFHPQVSPTVLARLTEGQTVSAEEEQLARALQAELSKYFDNLIARNGVIILPTTWATPPLKTDSDDFLLDNRKKNLRLTALSVAAGLPQVSIPIDIKDGVKLGLSIIGAREQDLPLLSLVRRLSSAASI